MEKLQRVQQRPLRPELEELSSKEELLGSVMKKNGNVTGESGILPKILKTASKGDTFMNQLLN